MAGGVWCDLLLVRYSLGNSNREYSTFYAVPFSSGYLTVERVISLESQLSERMLNEVHLQILGYEILNEMLVEEDKVETPISRQEMQVMLSKGEESESVSDDQEDALIRQRLIAITNLFKDGFCDDNMAKQIYETATGKKI